MERRRPLLPASPLLQTLGGRPGAPMPPPGSNKRFNDDESKVRCFVLVFFSLIKLSLPYRISAAPPRLCRHIVEEWKPVVCERKR